MDQVLRATAIEALRQSAEASSDTIEVLPRASRPQKRRGSALPAAIARPGPPASVRPPSPSRSLKKGMKSPTIARHPSPPRSISRVTKSPAATRQARPIQYARRGGRKSQPAPRRLASSSSTGREHEPDYRMVGSEPGPSVSRPSLRAKPLIPPRYTLEPDDSISFVDRSATPSPSPTPPPPPIVPRKAVIGIDFGATFTAIAAAIHNIRDKNPRVSPKEVKTIVNWPEDNNGGARAQVPTELWYLPVPISRDAISDESSMSGSEEDSDSDQSSPVPKKHNNRTSWSSGPFTLEGSSSEGTCWSPTIEEPSEHLWGYSVHHQKYRSSTDRDIMGHMDRPKLMLVNTKHTKGDRKTLRPRLKYLIEHGTIRKHGDGNTIVREDVYDVMIDFFVKALGHTKQQLIEREGLTDDWPVSFALTVPVVWDAHSSRLLQAAVQEAVRLTSFGTLSNGSLENVFIVSEPEAAATYLLGTSSKMVAGESFIVLDCGGGTVDGSTYTVTKSYPLRLNTEVGVPSGDNCGASYLNDAFEQRLLKRLEDEDYLDCNGETREDIVRHAVLHFENLGKRLVDIMLRPTGEVKIPGLRGDDYRRQRGLEPKKFNANYVLLGNEDYEEIFLPLLKRTAAVLRKQIQGAMRLEIEVRKVYLIGGFAASPSLRSYLKTYLVEFVRDRKLNYDIDLYLTNEQDCVTAIAAGAALRALNLKDGPERRAVSSYGFLRTEPYEPEVPGQERGHKEAKVWVDPFDEQEYVTVINWFIHKHDLIEADKEYEPLVCTHTFEVDEKNFECEEVLYVSDSDNTMSHYDVNHPMNNGAKVVGRITTGMRRHLRKKLQKGHILPVGPKLDEHGEMRGKAHYEITYDLVPVIQRRDLKYVAKYPSGEDGRVLEQAQICIAAGFKPGTG